MRTLTTAIGIFTVLPAPVRELDRAVAQKAMRVFPVVGVIVGTLAALVSGLFMFGSFNPVLGAVTGITVLAASTGAMHLDGLADTADGLGSRKPAEQALVVMRQSDIGPMGVATLILVVALQVTSLSTVAPSTMIAALIAGPMVARAVCVVATGTWLPGARTSGFGALFAQATSKSTAAIVAIASAVVAIAIGFAITYGFGSYPGTLLFTLFEDLGAPMGDAIAVGVGFAIASAMAFLVGYLATGWFRRRLGGLTGDTFGALIELSLTAFWLTLATLV